MTLTVRLDPPLAAALERYCTSTGVTKSLVVQESLVRYLVAAQAASKEKANIDAAAASPAPVSANYRAFAEAGLIGCLALGQGADKAAVRARVAQSFAERKARRGDQG
jgi:predicted transcriptional regulator